MTKRASVIFTAKQYADGGLWIVLEPLTAPESGFPEGMFGFDLPDGTSHDKAREIERFMSENLRAFTWTGLRDR